MKWDPKDRYKFLGKLIKKKDQLFFVFDLNSPQVTVRTVDENGKVKSAKNTRYPADWADQFGIPITEHDGQLMLNVFDDKAVFGLEKDPSGTSKEEIIAAINQESEVQEYEQLTILGTGLQANTNNRPEETANQNIQTNPTST